MTMRRFILLGCVGVGVYVLLFVCFGYASWRINEPQNAGLLGDMFGVLNAFFGGLAFFGVLVAILLQHRQIEIQAEELRLQRHELELQRKEVERNRQELARTAEAQEESLRALQEQVREMCRTSQIMLCHDLYPIFDSLGAGCLQQAPQDTEGHKKYVSRAEQCREQLERIFDEMSAIQSVPAIKAAQ